MNKRLFHILGTLLLITVLLSACSGTSGSSTKPPLRVAWSAWPGYYPMAIAAEKGFFEKHGVQVEPVYYNVYSNQSPDLASGMIDGAAIGLADTFYDSIANNIKIVLVVDNSAGAEQIVANSEISSPQNLRGKRIGISPVIVSGELLIRKMLADNGIDISEVTLVDVRPENVPQSIPGIIDAGYTYDPFTSQALAKGHKIVFTSADALGITVDVLAFRTEITQKRPEDVKAFIAAWLEAVEYWKANPTDANAIIAKATGLKPEEVSRAGVDLFDLDANQKTFIPGSTYISVYFTAQNELQFLTNAGDVTKPVDINKLIDPTFVK